MAKCGGLGSMRILGKHWKLTAIAVFSLAIAMALGSRPGQLLEMTVRHTLLVTDAGVVVGLLLGVGAMMLLQSQFYQIRAVEWTVLAPVSVAMLAVSSAVAYFSARPWLRINPMEAVRHA